MDQTTIIRIVAGFLAVSTFVVIIMYVAFLSGVLRKCSPASRTMEPGTVWFFLVPLVGIVMRFLVVNALAKSLANEFRLRNIPLPSQEPGKPVGLALAICGALMLVPFVNFVVMIPDLVLWIIYWKQIAGFSRMLDQYPVPQPLSGTPPSYQL